MLHRPKTLSANGIFGSYEADCAAWVHHLTSRSACTVCAPIRTAVFYIRLFEALSRLTFIHVIFVVFLAVHEEHDRCAKIHGHGIERLKVMFDCFRCLVYSIVDLRDHVDALLSCRCDPSLLGCSPSFRTPFSPQGV